MLKKNVSTLLISVIFLTALSPFHANAQTRSNQSDKNSASTVDKNSAVVDLRKVFAKSVVDEAPVIDSKQLVKENLNAAGKARLSKAQKTGLYIGIAAAIAATVIIIVVANKKDEEPVTGFLYAGCPGNPLCQ